MSIPAGARVRRPRPGRGEKRWISKTVHGSKRAARREMANMIAEVDKG